MSSSSQALVTIGQQAAGEVDFSSKLLKLKPTTVSIVQKLSNVVDEGVSPGKLYISETKEVFDTLDVVLLGMPKEGRNYSIAPKAVFPKPKDSIVCFSRDMVRPDERSTVPQADQCSLCQHAQWDNDTKTPPACGDYYFVALLDYATRMPLQTWIQGANKKEFESQLDNVSRELYKLKKAGKNPHYYDVKFTLGTKKTKNGKAFSFTILNAKPITDEESLEFAEIYQNFVGQNQETAAQKEVTETVAASRTVDAEIVNDSQEALDSDYVVEL